MTSYLVDPEGVARLIKGGRKETNTYIVMTSMFCLHIHVRDMVLYHAFFPYMQKYYIIYIYISVLV
jgi:hypothetical protein